MRSGRCSEGSTSGMDMGEGKLPLALCRSTRGDPENWVWANREQGRSMGSLFPEGATAG